MGSAHQEWHTDRYRERQAVAGRCSNRGDRIAKIGAGLVGEARETVDARGLLVLPGLIDLHTHLGFELHAQVVQPNDICPPAGVTAAIDMGSVGAFAFPWYRQRVLTTSKVRLYSFINIASLGTTGVHTPYYVENYGRYIDEADTLRTIEENRDYILGIKGFATSAMVGDWALEAVRAARRVAQAAKVPVCIHVSDAPPALVEVLDLLGTGDIITHTYTSHSQTILDEQGRVRPEVRAARERGVLFDLGHGAGSFSFDVARRAMDQGFLPDTISTDIYYANTEKPVKNLPTTMSKFINLGLSLEETLRRVSVNSAKVLRNDALGVLREGGDRGCGSDQARGRRVHLCRLAPKDAYRPYQPDLSDDHLRRPSHLPGIA